MTSLFLFGKYVFFFPSSLFDAYTHTRTHSRTHTFLRFFFFSSPLFTGSRPDMPFLVTPKLFPFGNYNIDFGPDPGTNLPFTWNGELFAWLLLPR